MSPPLRIIVADDEPDMRQYFQKILPRLGHQVIGAAADGKELLDMCRTHRPDLVITDIKMPLLDGIEAATIIAEELSVPCILVSAYHDAELVERAVVDHVFGYLVKPIKQVDLEPVIVLAMRRFAQFEALRHESESLKQALEERKQIERAKGILMKYAGVDEEQAFRRLQKLASNRNVKLAEAARIILAAEEAFRPSP